MGLPPIIETRSLVVEAWRGWPVVVALEKFEGQPTHDGEIIEHDIVHIPGRWPPTAHVEVRRRLVWAAWDRQGAIVRHQVFVFAIGVEYGACSLAHVAAENPDV